MNYRREIKKLGYEVRRGAYYGTCDHSIKGWYLDEIGSDTIDRRGPGYRTLRDAYEMLAGRVDEATQ